MDRYVVRANGTIVVRFDPGSIFPSWLRRMLSFRRTKQIRNLVVASTGSGPVTQVLPLNLGIAAQFFRNNGDLEAHVSVLYGPLPLYTFVVKTNADYHLDATWQGNDIDVKFEVVKV